MRHQTVFSRNIETFLKTFRIWVRSIEGSRCETMPFILTTNPRKFYDTFTRSVNCIQTESIQILWLYENLGCSFCKYSIASKLHDVKTISHFLYFLCFLRYSAKKVTPRVYRNILQYDLKEKNVCHWNSFKIL